MSDVVQTSKQPRNDIGAILSGAFRLFLGDLPLYLVWFVVYCIIRTWAVSVSGDNLILPLLVDSMIIGAWVVALKRSWDVPPKFWDFFLYIKRGGRFFLMIFASLPAGMIGIMVAVSLVGAVTGERPLGFVVVVLIIPCVLIALLPRL